MKKIIIILSLLFAINGMAANETLTSYQIQNQRIIQKIMIDSINAMADDDVNLFMSYWAQVKAATVVNPVSHEMLIGVDEIRRYVTISMQRKHVKVKLTNFQIYVDPNKQFAWGAANIHTEYVSMSGMPTKETRWLAIRFLNVDGYWKIVLAIVPYSHI